MAYGPGNYESPEECVAALLGRAWRLTEAGRPPVSLTTDAITSNVKMQRVLDDACDLLRRFAVQESIRRGDASDDEREWESQREPLDLAAVESVCSQLDEICPAMIAEDLCEAADWIEAGESARAEAQSEADAESERTSELEVNAALAEELREHGYSVDEATNILWRHGVISTGESAGEGFARMLEELQGGKVAS